jgi:hypothetical protein
MNEVCKCGHTRKQHSPYTPGFCDELKCDCSEYTEVGSILARLLAVEEQYKELKRVHGVRLDSHSVQIHALSGEWPTFSHDFDFVRGALAGYANTPLLLEALCRLVARSRP